RGLGPGILEPRRTWTGRRSMRIALMTLFPEMTGLVTGFGVTRRAIENGRLSLEAVNPRDFTDDRHRTVDDRPFGGGPGMVMKVEPLERALSAARERVGPARVIY